MSIESGSAVTSSRDTEIPVYAGSEVLAFAVSQMPPNIRIFTYVNGVNITNFTGPVTATAVIADPIITDQLGSALGYLYIPSTEGKYKFLAGEIRLTFGDSPNGVGDCKYISETTLMNHGLSLVDTEQGGTISLRRTEKFRTSVDGSSGEAATALNRLNPLSQTFFVDEVRYPLGIVLTGVALFVRQKDDKLPLGVELRPMSGSAPSTTEYFSGTSVFKSPTVIPDYVEGKNVTPTDFTFSHPIYLKPGEYAFCVLTKSKKYKLFSATSAGDKKVKNPFAGRLFKAQNAGTWTGVTNEDLTFYLRKAKFDTGTITFEMVSPDLAEIDYNRIRLLSTEIGLGDTASVEYKIQTTNDTVSREKTDLKTIVPGDTADLTGRQSAKNTGDIKLQVSMTTKNPDVSPMLDRQLMKAQVFRNSVVPFSTEVSNSELNPNHGDARSRYISKVVSLAEGFDSTGLEVRVDVNRKIGTDIEVFGRVMSRNDKSFDIGIKGRPWVRLPLVSPTAKSFAGTDDSSYTQEIYRILEPDLSYSVSANVASNVSVLGSYEDFAHYQIKVIFYANNPIYLPKIKKLVATSLI
jgi:hypothetical protein